ncbi:YhcH/YjgK/YiaL family protein [Mucilaginibacter antarcticus]|uniref:YhcH/YjgK/YiaL family protein n=3 Tax=Mucilaginibacter antarcticus TaxID=1855725 RepID=A0ABW5XNA3_9SPHI
MKKTSIFTIALLALICFFTTTALAQTSNWTTSGRKLNLFPGLNKAEFAKQTQVNKVYWDKAMAFLAATNIDTLSVGKHVIDGENIFVSVSEGPTKEYDKTSWESHRNYLDIHLMIVGKERIGMMDTATATVTNAYDAAKDVANYDLNTKGNYYVADPNTLLIFFPQDAHRPSIHVDAYDKVKKLVFKIRVAQ